MLFCTIFKKLICARQHNNRDYPVSKIRCSLFGRRKAEEREEMRCGHIVEGKRIVEAKADIEMTIIISSGWRWDAGDILFKIQSRNSLLQEDR